MDITKLRYFLKICEKTNISKAAQDLFITQQGLSKSIISLENELKVPLFYRTSDGMFLTKYGEAIKDHAELIVSTESKMLEAIDKLNNPQMTTLKVYFALGVLNSLPIDFMSKFSFAYPNIELIYNEYPDNICHQAVLDNEDCLGVVIGPVDDSIFDSELIKTHTPHANINKNHPLSNRSSLALSDLDKQSVIIVNENFQMYHNFIKACSIEGIHPEIVQTTGEIFITYKMSSLDKGIGISVDFVSEDIYFPNVRSIPIISDMFTWNVVVISKKNTTLNWAAKEFILYLKQYTV